MPFSGFRRKSANARIILWMLVNCWAIGMLVQNLPIDFLRIGQSATASEQTIDRPRFEPIGEARNIGGIISGLAPVGIRTKQHKVYFPALSGRA
jgi:hypothetical protein